MLGFDWAPSSMGDRTTFIEALVFEFCGDDEDEMRVFLAGHTAGTLRNKFSVLEQYSKSDVGNSLRTIKDRLAKKASRGE